jgi:hypothetical protein
MYNNKKEETMKFQNNFKKYVTYTKIYMVFDGEYLLTIYMIVHLN